MLFGPMFCYIICQDMTQACYQLPQTMPLQLSCSPHHDRLVSPKNGIKANFSCIKFFFFSVKCLVTGTRKHSIQIISTRVEVHCSSKLDQIFRALELIYKRHVEESEAVGYRSVTSF